MKAFWIYGLIFLLSFAGVQVFRRWSIRRKLFDVPNERSSHTSPTPRGGGLVFVLVCLGFYAAAPLFFESNFQWSYLLGASLVALVSWLDDLYRLPSIWRFTVHAVSATLIILTLGGFEELYAPSVGRYSIGLFGTILTFFWVVWLTNAYNFMDGIDGIAGIQALTAGFGWFLIGSAHGFPAVGFYGGVIAFACAGFLIQNWQPAKVFMGDVGSAFLGYSFAVLPLMARAEANKTLTNKSLEAGAATDLLFPAALILIWLFAFDTLWTFGRRILNGEKFWEAHRGHLYQKMVIGGWSHRFVSGLYGALSLLNLGLLYTSVLFEEAWMPTLICLAAESFALLFGLRFLLNSQNGRKRENRGGTED